MHPWMLEQLGREHRRNLEALATPRSRRKFAVPRRRRREPQPASAAASAAIPVARPAANAVSA